MQPTMAVGRPSRGGTLAGAGFSGKGAIRPSRAPSSHPQLARKERGGGGRDRGEESCDPSSLPQHSALQRRRWEALPPICWTSYCHLVRLSPTRHLLLVGSLPFACKDRRKRLGHPGNSYLLAAGWPRHGRVSQPDGLPRPNVVLPGWLSSCLLPSVANTAFP